MRRYKTEVSQEESIFWPTELAAKVKVIQSAPPVPFRAPLRQLTENTLPPQPPQPTPRPRAAGGDIDLSGMRGGFTLSSPGPPKQSPVVQDATGAASWVGPPMHVTPNTATTTQAAARDEAAQQAASAQLLAQLLAASKQGIGQPLVDAATGAKIVAAEERKQRADEAAAKRKEKAQEKAAQKAAQKAEAKEKAHSGRSCRKKEAGGSCEGRGEGRRRGGGSKDQGAGTGAQRQAGQDPGRMLPRR